MSRSIFLVIGSEYESSDVLGAFEAKRDAEALQLACQNYDAQPRPQSPPMDDLAGNDAAWDKYIKQDNRWRARHPGGKGAYSFDHFTVQKIRLREPADSPATAISEPKAPGQDEQQ